MGGIQAEAQSLGLPNTSNVSDANKTICVFPFSLLHIIIKCDLNKVHYD